MPRLPGEVLKYATDKKALLAEMGGKLDTVRDLLVTASGAVMTGDKSTAINDLLEAYETTTSVMEWIDEERGAVGKTHQEITRTIGSGPTPEVSHHPDEIF